MFRFLLLVYQSAVRLVRSRVENKINGSPTIVFLKVRDRLVRQRHYVLFAAFWRTVFSCLCVFCFLFLFRFWSQSSSEHERKRPVRMFLEPWAVHAASTVTGKPTELPTTGSKPNLNIMCSFKSFVRYAFNWGKKITLIDLGIRLFHLVKLCQTKKIKQLIYSIGLI